MNFDSTNPPSQPDPTSSPIDAETVEAQISEQDNSNPYIPSVPPQFRALPDQPVPLSNGGKIAWFVIAVVTAGMFALLSLADKSTQQTNAPDISSAELAQFEMQAKALIGQQNLTRLGSPNTDTDPAPAEKPDSELDDPSETNSTDREKLNSSTTKVPGELDVGPYAQRLCYVILVNEFNGPEQALEKLKTTDQRAADAELKLSEDQKTLRSLIELQLKKQAAGDFSSAEIEQADQQLLSKELGWLGELVLVPPGTENKTQRQQLLGQATQSVLMMAGLIFLGIIAALFGFAVLVVLIVLASSGKLRSHYAHQTGRHNIYAETFAIWMVVFFVGQLPFGLILHSLGVENELTQLALMPILFFGSLISLAWPVVRGIPFAEVRQDIGWKFGNPFVEGGIAGMAYSAILPALALAVVAVSLLIMAFGPQQSATDFSNAGGPSHPVQEYLAQGNLMVFGLVLLLACVAAPIVEETMFRGVFYRHLRDFSVGWKYWASIGFSCLLNSFIFAAIHPQGVFGIPLLMTLAISFSLVRHWRGSLLAPMLMHALNNFTVTMIAFFMM